MPKSADSLFLVLQKRFIKLDHTSARVSELHSLGRVSSFDVEQIFSGVYLDAFVSFERFIEDLFLGYVSGQVTSPSKTVKQLIKISPPAKAEQVLLAGKAYLDWMPYEHTKKRAELYFKSGCSFLSLDATETQLLLRLHQIRNALAHRSDHSLEKFRTQVIGNLTINPHDKKPGRFLLTIFRAHPKQTRLQNYLFEMLEVAKKLSS